ncbi:MAG TPA: peptidase MA family metallohydrolase, partial [Roseiflexaceae bacterium]|nr:peptidase MA family metallohydrolase [Roseiflexaceae bacterium]
MQHLLLTVVCACLLSLWPPPPALTPRLSVTIDDRGVTLDFPHSLTFAAHVAAPAGVERVTLEYGVDQLTCGEVTARAIPPVTPGAAAEVEWTWDMRQSGAPPPGAQIWYRWRVRDTDGAEHVSPEQRVTWLDQQHRWRQVSSGAMTLHWYEGPQAFAEELLAASAGALARLEDEIGLRPGAPVDLYIYHSMEDLRAAVLYEPGWTGGLAYASHNIVIMGIHPDNVAWGKRITAHELTHVLVGHMAFSCLGSIPTWLNEGIAVYGEGGPEPAQAQQLEDAIRADRLLSVRALSGNFAEDADRANLSYTQSYSLVRFLIDEYGRERLLEVFGRLRRGATIDDALEDVYGFGVEGLEDRWRAAVGARLRQEAGAAL